MLTNHAGVIDSSYRGEIIAVFRSTTDVVPKIYNVGDRFAQLIVIPYAEFEAEEVEQLSETERGEDGFGSTDKEATETSEQPNEETTPDTTADQDKSETEE